VNFYRYLAFSRRPYQDGDRPEAQTVPGSFFHAVAWSPHGSLGSG
jgi:hypothetical protein